MRTFFRLVATENAHCLLGLIFFCLLLFVRLFKLAFIVCLLLFTCLFTRVCYLFTFMRPEYFKFKLHIFFPSYNF